MKILAVALFASFAGGLLASASALAAHEYFATLTSVTATGENHTFIAGEATITCKKAEFKWAGTEGAHTVLDVTPAYKECKAFGTGALVTVVEKAQFEFGAPTEVKKGEFSMKASIIGEATARLRVTVTIGSEKCEVSFPVQKLMGEATRFINNVEETGGEVKAKIESISYTSNSECNGKVPASGTNGKYEGNAHETGITVK
ncbi:MAG TPA: hypothetical protein VHT29_11485 [Solirubrobacteraceae bacterium]|jgi:hypothetical protein|nr:hypothetical protein [Solirubrobacteraceae bacterium]